MYEQLAVQLDRFTAWHELPARAEAHGMAPLLWHHVQKSGISIPAGTQRILKGLYLRHRSLSQAHTRVLIEIISLLNQADIRPLLLKGLALAYQYYPDPALRPATDIDLLVKQDEVSCVRHLLAGVGYRMALPKAGLAYIPKELSTDSPMKDGISIHVEVHHYNPKGRIYDDHSRDQEFEGFEETPYSLTIGGKTILTSAPIRAVQF